MKKFYTMLAAVAVVASASAAPVAHKTEIKKSEFQPAKVKVENSDLSKVVVNAPAKKAAKRQAPARVAASELANTKLDFYVNSVRGVNFAEDEENAGFYTLTKTYMTAKDNTVAVNGFFEADVTMEGTLDPTTNELTFEVGQMSMIEGKYPATVFELDLETYEIYEEFTLTYDPKFHKLVYTPGLSEPDAKGNIYYTTALVLAEGFGDEDGFYGYYFEVEFALVNSSMFWYTYNRNTEEFTEHESEIFAGTNADQSEIYITGIFQGLFTSDIFEPITLEVDKVSMTATAIDQEMANANTPYAYYLWGFDDEGYLDDTVVTFDIKYDSDQYGDFITMNTDAVGIADMNFNGIVAYYPEIYVPLVDKSGVNNVAVADENAPVEYFNLQGVRVANPENGLYIRRQGNTVTKVIVK
ncbi:MAG: hypothetical protein J1F05_06375 [Muribaculaceae bacterium]|nr:hypothetical protein [Muribaculaceae bacterium]